MQEYIDFLKYCLDDSLPLPDNAKSIDWKDYLTWAEQQTIVGIVFDGIERANDSISVPREVLFQWIGYVQRIEQQNRLVNKRCVELVEEFRNAGFDSCILKGQGNSVMYPNPLSRMSGDIDVLVLPRKKVGIAERRIILMDYVHKRFPQSRTRYQHIDYNIFKGVEVEMHFIPTAKNNPVYNRRIQRWAEDMMSKSGWTQEVTLPEGVEIIPVPSVEFNIIYQMSHLMHHFFDEGIGLRQMIDYYFLLKARNNDVRSKREDVISTLKYLNLYNFAGAVMYIMKEVLGLDEKCLIVPVDERRGKTLLNEILKGGNFGHSSNLAQNNAAKKYFQKIWRNMHFVREYPAEALCEPVFRTWHFFWRLSHR